MCNVDCYEWVKKNLSEEEVKGKRVLEVGSMNVNGSVRGIIAVHKPSEYIGIDMEAGPGVDIVCRAEKLVERFGKESFDIVVSTCLLEHVRDWQSVVSNIKQVCKKNGLILLIVPAIWPFHAFPHDYWRYRESDIKEIFSDCEIVKIEVDRKSPALTYAKIRKPEGFLENDISHIKLYSVLAGKKVQSIRDEDLISGRARRLVIMGRIRELVGRTGKLIFKKNK